METLFEISKIIVSAFLGALAFYLFESHRLRKQKRTIEDENEQKELTVLTVRKLLPGHSIEKMKSMLGEELQYDIEDSPVFDSEDINSTSKDKTHSYIYVLKDVLLKITSKDNKKIDSFTIRLKYVSKTKLDLSSLFLDAYKIVIGETKVTKQLLELVQGHTVIRTMIENCAALQFYLPRPIYKSFTIYVGNSVNLLKYYDTNNIEELIGTEVFGICISEMKECSFYIYDYELSDYLTHQIDS